MISEEITWLNGFRGDDFGLVASEEITWLNGFREDLAQWLRKEML